MLEDSQNKIETVGGRQELRTKVHKQQNHNQLLHDDNFLTKDNLIHYLVPTNL